MKQVLIVLLYRLYSKVVYRLRVNRYVFRVLFGYNPIENRYGSYWDWTTLIIKQYLDKYIESGSNILDMGTGPYGILAHHISRNYPMCNVTAVDHCFELIEFARRNDSESKIKYINSDLFSEINDKFDLIMFNAPYINSKQGKNLNIMTDVLSKKRWQGGESGSETIKRFLHDCYEFLNINGIVLLGVNHFYLDNDIMDKMIAQSSLLLEKKYTNKITKSSVYVLIRGNAE